MSHRPTSAAGPTSSAFMIVPKPGFWRIGIHRSNTMPLVITVIRPKLSPVCFAMPCVSTSHGATPSSPRTMRAMPMP